MKTWKRVAIASSVIVVVAAIGLAGRIALMAGVFDEVKPLPLKCDTLTGAVGVEDIAIDRKTGVVFLSATDRRAMGASKTDGIFAYYPGHPEKGIVKLAGAPKEFHPHGISLYRDPDGTLTLMAVNHVTSAHHVIDIFDVAKDGGALNLIGAVESDKMIHPNDVAAVGRERFYLTNDHGSTTAFGMQLENYLMLPRANVLYYDGAVFKEVATGLVFANGIAVSNDGGHVYVAESTGRHIQTFARDPFSGRLGERTAFDFPSGPDNIDVGPDGTLWVAGHPKMFALVGYSTDASKPSPTEIFKVAVKDGIPQSAVPVYVDQGKEIGAGSVGAVAGDRLFIGSIFDPKVLSCRLK